MTLVDNSPRLVVAGLAGDSGKSIVSLAILQRLRQDGIAVRGFKKGPDYVDAAWLSWASGSPARNLDSWLMGFDIAALSFDRHCLRQGLNLVEGNRGLFDGADPAGTHSTAELAKALHAPVLLVVNVAKMTRTAAALVLGCQHLDPHLQLAGVILNRVHGARHEAVIRAAIESATGLPVLGAIPAMKEGILPDRHLGLVTPSDSQDLEDLPRRLNAVASHLDMQRILSLAAGCNPLSYASRDVASQSQGYKTPVRIAVVRDAAFNFYYPENLEALAAGGAELVFVSALEASQIPDGIDAIYIGGGFPEVHAQQLAANTYFLQSLFAAAERNVPIYAECGGLMLLARSIQWNGTRYAMSGALPIDVDVDSVPQGHGYVEMAVTEHNPFFPEGAVLHGHEFHYSHIVRQPDMPIAACKLNRGTGCYDKRDGLIQNNIWTGYTHLHAAASPEWATGLLRAAREHKAELRVLQPASIQSMNAPSSAEQNQL
ncbi:MAG: cobyrinate a,c-diamide synthase [Terracidiphilus sp.]|nr:cobyrinate a,c-diamide synthase [Terracidiphilus sp.]